MYRSNFLIIFITVYVLLVNSFTYKSYQNKIECKASSPILYPKNLSEILKIINGAIATKLRVKVVGSRHSISDTICTDGIPINIKHFNKVAVNKTTLTASIGAGIELLDALDQLHSQGYTINGTPAYGGITVGGAIGLGAHGSSLRHPNTLSEYLVGLTFIDGRGVLRNVALGDEHFDAFRVNFGLLGVIIEATFKIEPSFKMKMRNYRVSDAFLVNTPSQLVTMARNNDWFQFWWFPTNQGLVISEGQYYDSKQKVDGDAKTNFVANVAPVFTLANKFYLELAQTTNSTLAMNELEKITENSFYRINFSVIFREPFFVERDTNKFVNPAVGYGYRLMTSRCDPCLWDAPEESKLKKLPKLTSLVNNVTDILKGIPIVGNFVPLAVTLEDYSIELDINKFPAVIADMNDLLKKYPISFALLGLFFRFSPKSKGLLAPSTGQDTFIIEWAYPIRVDPYNTPSYGLATMQALTQLLVFKHKGRPHWGKNGLAYFSSEIIHKAYPQQNFDKFKLAVQHYDPDRLFSNKFGDRLLGIGVDKFDIPDKVTHCALQDYCICKKDSDCSSTLKCKPVLGYPVCKK